VALARVTVTGASGLIGTPVVAALQRGGAEVTVLARDPARTQERLQRAGLAAVEAFAWDLLGEPAPAAALAGRDAIVHLAGENVAQRWSDRAKRAIRESRVTGTRNLLAGVAASEPRPGALVIAWEAEAAKARDLGLRVACLRTGVVLNRDDGALAKMLPPFRLGVGGPVAGGRQFVSWIHRDDVVAMYLAALEDERWSGPLNATAPDPVSNRELARSLGHALHRPALVPVPGAALRLLYGEMAEIVMGGARVMPARPLVLGYEFVQPQLEQALAAALAGS